MSERGYLRRKWTNGIMLGLSGGAAGISIIILALILGYILVNGISFINLDFVTQAAKPAGEIGGGMRNEIIGTFILVILASVIALPLGLMTGRSSFHCCRCIRLRHFGPAATFLFGNLCSRSTGHYYDSHFSPDG
jgi:ABC-type phosphate transport system permease subunit